MDAITTKGEERDDKYVHSRPAARAKLITGMGKRRRPDYIGVLGARIRGPANRLDDDSEDGLFELCIGFMPL